MAVFYTDQVGLTAGVVALLLLAARILDAVIDPVIGGLAERTHGKHGRFRPWILYGAVPLGGMMVLTFLAPFPGGSMAAVIWADAHLRPVGHPLLLCERAVRSAGGRDDRVARGTGRTGLRAHDRHERRRGRPGHGDAPGHRALQRHRGREDADGDRLRVDSRASWAAVAVLLFLFLFRSTREVVVPARTDRAKLVDTVKAVVTNKPLSAGVHRRDDHAHLLLRPPRRRRLLRPPQPRESFSHPVADERPVGRRGHLHRPAPPAEQAVRQANAADHLACWAKAPRCSPSSWSATPTLPLVLTISFLYGLTSYGTAVVLSMVPDTVDHQEEQGPGLSATDGTAYANDQPVHQGSASAVGALRTASP
ncbi:MFS transporter [Streptomyces sp. L7]